MRSALTLLLCLVAGANPALAQSSVGTAPMQFQGPPVPPVATGVVRTAQDAAKALRDAVAALDAATGAKDRVAALTSTIGAYEQAMTALREGLRQASIREAALLMQFQAQRDRLGQLIAVLSQLESSPEPLLLLHPSGPLGTVRSGLMVADVTPALHSEAEALRRRLEEVRDLRGLQNAAGKTLAEGLRSAQQARTALAQAISARTDLPRSYTADPAAMRNLAESVDTMDAFADSLVLKDAESEASGIEDFGFGHGRLPLPVQGALLRRPDEADAAGTRRPGMVLAARKRALVTAPWAGTIRYRGPLLDFGNVMILEPGPGYLLILAGMESVYGEMGEIVSAGAPLGMMGGGEPGMEEFLTSVRDGGGARDTETLYVELRQGGIPVDPMPWFEATAPLAREQQVP